jgi:hypothetical protein
MKFIPFIAGVAAIALSSTQAAAQADTAGNDDDNAGESAPEPASETTTRRTFTPEDFARFAPRTALDMARQVPGFSIREGDGARGLGQADTNVLLNGLRISGKSNGPVDALQRIPVEEVVRLELVDGASLDIGGLTGQVLNVVTASSGRISGQFRYSPQFRSKGTPARLLNGSVALAGGGRKTEWTLALENDSQRRGNDGIELVFDAAGALIDTRNEQSNFSFDTPSLSGSLTRSATNGNVLNLTGEVQGFFITETESSLRSGTIDPVDRTRTFRRTEDEYNFELGADYQFEFGPGRLKLIAYHRYEDSPTVSSSITEFANGAPAQGTVFTRDADEGETILRAEYNFKGLGGDLLFAGEAVRNFLDITSALEARDALGVLQPVAFDGASARVEEDRADFGLTYSRALAPGLQLQLSGGAEYSQISQSGAQGQTRSFWRPKGFVALDWKAGGGVNISGRIERQVGQLSFFDFIASVDLNQDREDVTNADLVPQQSWTLELETNVALGALGSINLRPFYEDISDIVDQIPIAGGGQAPGNIPSARFYGIEGDVTVLSEGIGWRGTRLDLGFFLSDSSVRDPLLGTDRRLSDNTLINLGVTLRHDLPGTTWAFGGSTEWQEQSLSVRLDEISLNSNSFGFVQAFVENKDVAGLTLRANIGNLVNQRDRFDRTVFIDRAAGIVDFVEERDRTFGLIFTFDIEGSF